MILADCIRVKYMTWAWNILPVGLEYLLFIPGLLYC